MTNDPLTRRRFLKLGAIGVVSVPLGAVTLRASGGEMKMLSEEDATAKALGYHADAASVDAGAFPTFDPAQDCSNCVQYKGEADSDAGLCALFPGKKVAARGWCKVWVTS